MLERFSRGVNIDNIWRYCGNPPPKSAIVPFVVSLRLARGPVDIFEHTDASQAIQEHIKLPDEAEPPAIVKEVCDDLAIRLKEAKISFVRTWFPWNFFQKSVNETTTTTTQFVMDTFVDTLKSNGIDILGVLANGYSRFLPQGASVDHLDGYLKQLTPILEEIVSLYKRSIDTWQLENEPNFWKEHLAVNWRHGLIWLEHGAEEKILGTLYNVVRQECPNAKIVVNIEADRHPVNWEFYAKYCDIIGLDFYPAYAHPLKTSAEEIKNISEDVRKQTGKPLIVAETGQPSGPHILGYNEQRQAEYIESACEEAYSSDAINALCVWRFSDSYWKSFPMQENYFGLLTKEMESKPAWSEYVNQIKDKN
jgi:hypothetical protein